VSKTVISSGDGLDRGEGHDERARRLCILLDARDLRRGPFATPGSRDATTVQFVCDGPQ